MGTKLKLFTVPLMVISLLASSVSFLPVRHASAAMTPGGAVGLVNPTTGFPNWYKDQGGLALELMEAADAFGISTPVEAGNAFSQQIGFGPEGFWWSAGASIDGTIQKQAKLTLALEAAFGGESAIDGEQSAFGRVRYRIDSLTPGAMYIVSHPYGTVTGTADVDGVIDVTEDIGCFAVAGSKSCDPNSPLGSPLAPFNFGAALSSSIGPFLTWDTFNVDPAQTDPQLVNPNPAYAGKQYVGNPSINHTVTGSPINQNIFRVAGPGLPGGAIETALFSVTGRLAPAAAPVVNPIANQAVQINNLISFTASAADANLDPITFSVVPVSALGNEATATIDSATGVFSWTPNTVGTSSFSIGASDGVLSSTATVTIEVTAVAPVLAAIQVTPATADIIAGATRQFVAAALDANGAQIISAPVIVWTSGDGTKATVDAATGLVAAVASGTATITATSGAVSGTAQATVIPAVQVGGGLTAAIPVDLTTSFPKWYRDGNGLALELMEAADTFGISAPVEVGNAFSQQIGFGPEGFWATADATMATTGSKPAVLVQAVEAAFAGESAVDGQQSAFGRIRIRIDVNDPGTYVVTYPYGQRTYTIAVDAIGAGYEINDTSDIGCFAIPGVTSCDPNNLLGSPQAAFNFNGVGLSEIGPFLSWDTFDPLNNDPALTNPANPTRKYLGNAAVAHAIKGSPTNNNLFRIEGPAGVDLDPAAGVQSTIETNLFNVSGRLADIASPVITVTAPNPDSALQGIPYVDPGATAVDAFDGNVTANIQATTISTAVLGPQTITYTVADTAGNIATATRTVNIVASPTDVIAPVMTLNGLNPESVIIGATYTDAGATATDNVDGDITANITTTGLPIDTAAAGAHVVTYSVSDAALNSSVATRIVNVTSAPAAATTVVIASAAPTIVTGATQQLSVAVLDPLGAAITPTPEITFTTADAAVATVDQAGIVTAVAPGGPINITATVTGVPAATTTIPITIAVPDPAPVVTNVNVAMASPAIIVGATQQLSVAVLDQNGAAVVSPPAITLVSDTPAVATVDPATGIVTAVAPGTAIITLTSDGHTDTQTIVVSAALDTSAPEITITGTNPATMLVGAAYNDAGATAIDNVDGDITANIITTGLPIDTAAAGAHVVTYSVSDAALNSSVATRIVNVSATPVIPVVTQIEATPISPTLSVNATQQFTAEAKDQNGIRLNPQPTFTWQSSDQAVGTIDVSGMFTALSAGTTIITASSGGVSGTSAVTVETQAITPAFFPVYRFWSNSGKSHFYTISETEKNEVDVNYGDDDWLIEGVAFQAYSSQEPGTLPIYRFWSKQNQTHFFTASEGEKDQVIADFTDDEWIYEGVAYYAHTSQQPGTVPLHRFWSNQDKTHFYTVSETEKDQTIANFTADQWSYEGTAYWVPISQL